MHYKNEFDKYLNTLSEVYKKYHYKDLNFRDKNKVLQDMKALEVILDNIIYLCTNNEGLNKTDLKLEIEKKLSYIDLVSDIAHS